MIAGSSLRAKLCLAAGPLSYPYGFGSVWWELSAVWLQARCRTGTGSLQYGCGLCCLVVGSVPMATGSVFSVCDLGAVWLQARCCMAIGFMVFARAWRCEATGAVLLVAPPAMYVFGYGFVVCLRNYLCMGAKSPKFGCKSKFKFGSGLSGIQLPNGKPATVPLDIDGWVGGLIG